MLAIGRCLMGAPELVMFDEPSLGLAPAVVQNVLRTIRDLNREGLTCLLVEQNVAVSLKLAVHAYVLENGRITLSGSGRGTPCRRSRAPSLSRDVSSMLGYTRIRNRDYVHAIEPDRGRGCRLPSFRDDQADALR